MKLAMAMDTMLGEDEPRRQQEIHEQRQQTQRAKSQEQSRQRLAAIARKSFLFVLSAVIVVFLAGTSPRVQDFTKQITQTISSRTISHSVIKREALQYQKEVDDIAKQ